MIFLRSANITVFIKYKPLLVEIVAIYINSPIIC